MLKLKKAAKLLSVWILSIMVSLASINEMGLIEEAGGSGLVDILHLLLILAIAIISTGIAIIGFITVLVIPMVFIVSWAINVLKEKNNET